MLANEIFESCVKCRRVMRKQQSTWQAFWQFAELEKNEVKNLNQTSEKLISFFYFYAVRQTSSEFLKQNKEWRMKTGAKKEKKK